MTDQSRAPSLHTADRTLRSIPGPALDVANAPGISDRGPSWRDTAIVLLIGAAVCAVALNSQSYWIDEAVTVRKTIVSTVPDLWHTLRAEGNANLQVPLYFLFAWGWEKLAGSGELAMRAGNVPWFLLGLLAVTRAFSHSRPLKWGISAALLASPFAWYYLNEARPYSIQLACSVIVLAASYRLLQYDEDYRTERRWLAVWCVGAILLAASGLFAMLWLGAYALAFILSRPIVSSWALVRRHWKLVLLTVAMLLALGIYYLWTMTIGARATEGTMNISTVLFIPYELLGFSGLGPGRLDLRSMGARALMPWAPAVMLYSIALCGVLVPGLKRVMRSVSCGTIVSWAAVFLLMIGLVMGLSSAARFRLLGRHCMPLEPLALAMLGAGIAEQLTRARWLGMLSVITFVGLSLYSCSSLRWSERHAKDDYRDAVALGEDALKQGQAVWWNADKEGALIYRLPLAELPGESQKALCLRNPARGFSDGLRQPDVVITSRPDKYDVTGAVGQYLVNSGFRAIAHLQAFDIWRKPMSVETR